MLSRPGTAADAVDGIIPTTVVEPATADEVAATLERASRDKRAVFTRGAGTKVGWGPAPQPIDILISTARLNRVVAHRHGDLTATVEAGATLAAVNQELAIHRQWIPLDPPWADRATIGGIVATNDSGPRRHRYGAPRDLIIGMEFARADGKLAKGGGIVVKNVAGYDMSRLMTGSFGSLSTIITATFKLYPLTQASRTLAVDLKQYPDLGGLVSKMLGSHLTPTALEFATHPLRLFIRFESIDAAVEQQSQQAQAMIGESGFSARALGGPDEERLWQEHAASIWSGAGAVVKVTLLATELAGTLALLESLAGAAGFAAAGRAGLGVFLARIDCSVDAQSRAITGLRAALAAGRGSVVIVRGSAELKAKVDVWGSVGDGLGLMRAVKQRFDPAGLLNAGRGPGGL